MFADTPGGDNRIVGYRVFSLAIEQIDFQKVRLMIDVFKKNTKKVTKSDRFNVPWFGIEPILTLTLHFIAPLSHQLFGDMEKCVYLHTDKSEYELLWKRKRERE